MCQAFPHAHYIAGKRHSRGTDIAVPYKVTAFFQANDEVHEREADKLGWLPDGQLEVRVELPPQSFVRPATHSLPRKPLRVRGRYIRHKDMVGAWMGQILVPVRVVVGDAFLISRVDCLLMSRVTGAPPSSQNVGKK